MKIKSSYSENLLVIMLLIFSTSAFAQIGFGSSASCNINAVCDYPWCNQRRSVVLISWYKNNTLTVASGALLTNEKRDGRPYILTAAHILDLNGDASLSNTEEQHVNTYTFTFNYQSQNCPNPPTEPTKSYTLVGAVVRKYLFNKSDFALLELIQRPPGNFNVFLSGWNNKKEGEPENIHMIHHPEGDIKKISYSIKKLKKKGSDNYLWRLKGWTDGTAQGGSSGAPWYDQNKLVVGQQKGAENLNDPCEENKQSDAGRFWYSWDEGPSFINKMKSVLNPNGTGNVFIQSMGGEDACKSSYAFSNANDLHTSANVNGMPPFTNPLPGTRSYDGVYMASGNISAGPNVTILSSTSVKFLASDIVLSAGFTASNGSDFLASIQPCIGGCDASVGKMADNGKSDDDLFVIGDGSSENDEENDEDYSEEGIVSVSDKIIIFPNPSNGQFTFFTSSEITDAYSIKIYDNIGRTVFSQSNISIPSVSVDLSIESKGVYFVHVTIKEVTYYKKIVLQ